MIYSSEKLAEYIVQATFKDLPEPVIKKLEGALGAKYKNIDYKKAYDNSLTVYNQGAVDKVEIDISKFHDLMIGLISQSSNECRKILDRYI